MVCDKGTWEGSMEEGAVRIPGFACCAHTEMGESKVKSNRLALVKRDLAVIV
jgi:hypothetical protein